MEIWLSNGYSDKIQLPVNPQSIGYKDSNNFEDIVLANGDEKTVISGRGLRTYSISSFFPSVRPYFAERLDISAPMKYVGLFQTWMDNKNVLLLQVTNTNINEQVTIRSFEWEEKGGTVGDVEYTIELKQYKPVSVSKTAINDSKTELPGKSDVPRPPVLADTPESVVVKTGDSLWLIAKRVYKDGSLYTKIYEANKPAIGSNPNLIYPGQTLVIPK
ncbi:MAG TPA: LysM peptidoglycan-binding domain-containing protein [Pseudoneobacillus sp.]|nr:LysM peptidoglycan-binding domain-containing protein [Pseudoneobacillus sp.]